VGRGAGGGRGRRSRTRRWTLGGAAFGTGAIGVARYPFDNPSAEGLNVAPVVGGSRAGLAVAGQF